MFRQVGLHFDSWIKTFKHRVKTRRFTASICMSANTSSQTSRLCSPTHVEKTFWHFRGCEGGAASLLCERRPTEWQRCRAELSHRVPVGYHSHDLSAPSTPVVVELLRWRWTAFRKSMWGNEGQKKKSKDPWQGLNKRKGLSTLRYNINI